MAERSIEGWVTVFQSGTDYESEIVRDRLDDAGIAAVVLTHRDHAFNLTVGDMAKVRVLVPEEDRHAALAVLHSRPVSDEDLEAAALASNPILEDDADDDTEGDAEDDADETPVDKPNLPTRSD